MSNDIQPRKLNKALVAEFLNYVSSVELLRFLKEQRWDFRAELTELLKLARTSPNPHVRLKAIAAIRERINEALEREGLLTKATRMIKGEGGADVTVFTSNLLANSLPGQNENLTEEDQNAERSDETKKPEPESEDRSYGTHRRPEGSQDDFPGISAGDGGLSGGAKEGRDTAD